MAHKPTEFGRLVRVDEVENGIVSGCEVLEGNAADTKAWGAALKQHQLSFGRPPADGDGGKSGPLPLRMDRDLEML